MVLKYAVTPPPLSTPGSQNPLQGVQKRQRMFTSSQVNYKAYTCTYRSNLFKNFHPAERAEAPKQQDKSLIMIVHGINFVDLVCF